MVRVDKWQVIGYNINMIKTFKHKGLEKFFKTGSMKGIQSIHKERLEIILSTLNVMRTLDPLKAPSYALHPLKGDMKGQWAVTGRAYPNRRVSPFRGGNLGKRLAGSDRK